MLRPASIGVQLAARRRGRRPASGLFRPLLWALLSTACVSNDPETSGESTAASAIRIDMRGPTAVRVDPDGLRRIRDGMPCALDEGDTYVLRGPAGEPCDSARVASLTTGVGSNGTSLVDDDSRLSDLETAAAGLSARMAALDGLRACPTDMRAVGSFCIDRYEASVWSTAACGGTRYGATTTDDYPAGFVDNGNITRLLYACSVAGVIPSRNITWFQAQQACVASNKRLCTNEEWQAAAAGTPDDATSCNVNTTAAENAGARTACVSANGVNDMVGNLWEWVSTWSVEPGWNGTESTWPDVAGVSYGADHYTHGGYATTAAYGTDGSVLVTGATAAGSRLPAGTHRGGSYDSSTAAGVFTTVVSHAPFVTHVSFGFRCCRDR